MTTLRFKSHQNKITIRLKLIPSLGLHKKVDQSKTALRLKSDQNKIKIRSK